MDETREQVLRDRARIQRGESSQEHTMETAVRSVELRAYLLRILFEELKKNGFSHEEALRIAAAQSI